MRDTNVFKERFYRFIPWLSKFFEQRWLNVGLRTKMGTMVTAGLAGLTLIFGLMVINTARQAIQQVLDERLILARLTANTIDSSLRNLESILTLIASDEVFQDPLASPADQDAALRLAFNQLNGVCEGLFLLDRAGQPVRWIPSDDPIETGWLKAPAVNQIIAEQTGSSEPVLSLISDSQPQVVFAVPIHSASGDRVGSLVALIDFTQKAIITFDWPLGLGETGVLDLVDSNGRILNSSKPVRVMQRSEQTNLAELFKNRTPISETCLACYENIQGEAEEVVIAFVPLAHVNWAVVVHQHGDEVFTSVRQLTVQIIVLALVSILGALVLVWITTNSVIRPVQALTQAAARIADGDLTTPVKMPSRYSNRFDEIGVLTKSFDAMRERLRRSIEEIQGWNRELDIRVRERTQAATEAQLEAQAARDDLRAIIDALSDELVVVNLEDRRVELFNQAVQNRCPPANPIIGQSCYQVFHCEVPCQAPHCECSIPKVIETGQSVRVTHEHPGPDQGQIIYVDIVASPMYDASGRITRIVELSRDVTEERAIRESLLRSNQRLSILNNIATTVNQSLNLEVILERALDTILRLTEIDMGAVFLQEYLQNELRLMAYRGLSEDAAHLAANMGLLDGSCGGVMERGQLVIVPDLSRFKGRRALSLKRERLRTLVHVPLIAKGSSLGSMCIGTHKRREFSLEEQELLTAIGSQIAVAIENARLYAEVQHKEQVRGELFKKAITAQEEERRRIARELHDETSQNLTALIFSAEGALEAGSIRAMKKQVQSMHDLAQHTLDGVHKLIFDLRPSMLDHLGLVPAIRWFATSRLESRDVRVTVEDAPSPRRLPPEVETALFRVVQEAITNIARHSAARNVCILFQYSDTEAIVTVEDDGIGFDIIGIDTAPDTMRGLGILSMQERVELLGGELDIASQPGMGTQIHIRIPLTQRQVAYESNSSADR